MERRHATTVKRRGSCRWGPLLLCWVLCAGTAGCAYDRTPACPAQVAVLMPDSTPEPDRWVTEHFCMRSSVERIERQEPGTYTMKDYSIVLNTANQRDVVIPAWSTWGIVYFFGPMGVSQYSSVKGACYAMQYEYTLNPVSVDEDPAAPSGTTVVFKLVPWNNDNHDFRTFIAQLSETDYYGLLKRKMERWRSLAKKKEHRPAVRAIVEWYIARYDAAVRQDPELAKKTVARQNIDKLREFLLTVPKDD